MQLSIHIQLSRQFTMDYASPYKVATQWRSRRPHILCFNGGRPGEPCDGFFGAYFRPHVRVVEITKKWGCLRFDNHRGLEPKRMRLRPLGLKAVLTRTKTSGVGKKVHELPLYVSALAYFVQPGWLRTGFELWESTDKERDYFLGLPRSDLETMRNIEAKYSDGAAMSSAILRALKDSTGQPLLAPEAITFWSEHSERACLPSWTVPCLSFPQEWVDILGKRGAKRSESYVRTAFLRMRKIQEAIAVLVRSAAADTTDVLDESDLLEELTVHLERSGLDATDIMLQGDRLLQFKEAAITPGEVPTDIATLSNSDSDESGSSPASSSSSSASSSKLTSLPALGIHVVAIYRKVRRLHKIGACYRKPGLDFANYEVLSADIPDPPCYNRVCKDCFPRGLGYFTFNPRVTDDGISTSTASSSESSE